MTTGAGRSAQTKTETQENAKSFLLENIITQLKIVIAQNNEVHNLNMNETDVRGK